ncbi:MAG: GerMN domain-containing protein [Bacilli bacterium]|nr:GerMN domain-containing protein [Bacilli bacterium]
MLKKSAFRRIAVTSVALFIFTIISIFPTSLNDHFESETTTNPSVYGAIYLIDPNQYVARTQVVIKNNDSLNQAKEIIEMLTINGKKSHYLPNGFTAVIPSGTKVEEIDIQNGILKINFNETFLKIPKGAEEDVIESLIYSLTEIKDVQGLLIYVNGELMTKLPNTNIKLPTTLTRDYGINKIYDLTKIQNVTKTTTYYVSKYQDFLYYVPVTEITNNEKEKVEIIIERLKSSPTHQTNLMSYLNANAELLDYEILENDIHLSFNQYLLDDFQNKQILEEVEYSIALSMKDTLDVQAVNFSINGEKITTKRN